MCDAAMCSTISLGAPQVTIDALNELRAVLSASWPNQPSTASSAISRTAEVTDAAADDTSAISTHAPSKTQGRSTGRTGIGSRKSTGLVAIRTRTPAGTAIMPLPLRHAAPHAANRDRRLARRERPPPPISMVIAPRAFGVGAEAACWRISVTTVRTPAHRPSEGSFDRAARPCAR
jgi:hypothetical protein